MNYPIDDYLDNILRRAIDSGIISITTEDGYYITISFRNGSTAELWNENRYYAWLSRGNVDNYHYDGARPKKSTMRKLRKAMKFQHNYTGSQFK